MRALKALDPSNVMYKLPISSSLLNGFCLTAQNDGDSQVMLGRLVWAKWLYLALTVLHGSKSSFSPAADFDTWFCGLMRGRTAWDAARMEVAYRGKQTKLLKLLWSMSYTL